VPVIDYKSVFGVGVMVVVIAGIASLYSAFKAASLKLIDALRS